MKVGDKVTWGKFEGRITDGPFEGVSTYESDAFVVEFDGDADAQLVAEIALCPVVQWVPCHGDHRRLGMSDKIEECPCGADCDCWERKV